MYSFFNLGAKWGWVVNAKPRPLHARERHDTHYIGGWVGLRACLDRWGKPRPHPDHPAPSESVYRLRYAGCSTI